MCSPVHDYFCELPRPIIIIIHPTCGLAMTPAGEYNLDEFLILMAVCQQRWQAPFLLSMAAMTMMYLFLTLCSEQPSPLEGLHGCC